MINLVPGVYRRVGEDIFRSNFSVECHSLREREREKGGGVKGRKGARFNQSKIALVNEPTPSWSCIPPEGLGITGQDFHCHVTPK